MRTKVADQVRQTFGGAGDEHPPGRIIGCTLAITRFLESRSK